MLLVKTKIAPSAIHGMGLFAEEFIPKEAVIWKFVAGFDKTFTREQIESFPPAVHVFLTKYAYFSKKTGRYRLDSDNGRYFNHSKTPNTSTKSLPKESEDIIYANRDIQPGEEITVNYADQEEDHAEGNILGDFLPKISLGR